MFGGSLLGVSSTIFAHLLRHLFLLLSEPSPPGPLKPGVLVRSNGGLLHVHNQLRQLFCVLFLVGPATSATSLLSSSPTLNGTFSSSHLPHQVTDPRLHILVRLMLVSSIFFSAEHFDPKGLRPSGSTGISTASRNRSFRAVFPHAKLRPPKLTVC